MTIIASLLILAGLAASALNDLKHTRKCAFPFVSNT